MNIHQGNLFDLVKKQDNVIDIIIHGCNAQGVMGSGIAKEVKARYPGAFTEYSRFVKREPHLLGNICLYSPDENTIIVNAITQFFYGTDKRHVDYEAIAQSFEKVVQLARSAKELDNTVEIRIHFPKIGAGLAGGNWNIISTIIEETVNNEFETNLYIL